jgi:hypothetical protein
MNVDDDGVVSEERTNAVLKLVQDLFQSEGASLFTSKIAIGFLQVDCPVC